MRKLVLRVFDYSLDGIIGEEDTGFFEFCRQVPDDPAQEAWERNSLENAEVHIMGRVTYQGMAQYFPTATGHPYAGIMNQARKAVFSGTLKTADWVNSTILNGDIATEIEKLRSEGTGEILLAKHVTVADDPNGARYYWDQRLTARPDTGELVAMFWTHDSSRGQDLDVHLARGSPTGRQWETPVGTGLPGQHCQPISLGGDDLAAVYVHRRDPPGIRIALSRDYGRTWQRSGEVVVYESSAGPEAGARGPREIGDYWSDMIKWRFGHPRGICLPLGEIFVAYYAGGDDTTTVRWARVTNSE